MKSAAIPCPGGRGSCEQRTLMLGFLSGCLVAANSVRAEDTKPPVEQAALVASAKHRSAAADGVSLGWRARAKRDPTSLLAVQNLEPWFAPPPGNAPDVSLGAPSLHPNRSRSGWISNPQTVHVRQRLEGVAQRTARPEDMLHGNSPHHQRIRDQ